MTIAAHKVGVKELAQGRIIEVGISGKLTRSDYDEFVPKIDEAVERYGQIRLLLDFVGFEGLTMGALFEDTRFAFLHYNAIFRLAVVGDKRWEQVMTTLCKPFTNADVVYYDVSEIELARAWLREGVPSAAFF